MGQSGWSVEEYTKADGESPFGTFFRRLTERHRDDAASLLLALREHGNMLRPPRSKKVEDNLFELRGYQVRIFCLFLPAVAS